MANLPGTDNIPDIDVSDWLSHLDDDIGDFLAAAEGEEVRGGFTDMANVIANVIHKQATYATDDFSDSSTNAAAQAAAVAAQLALTLQNKGMLASGSFNDVEAENGFWTLTASNTYTDIPEDLVGTSIAGSLIQIKYTGSSGRIQILFVRGGAIYTRLGTGSAMEDWKATGVVGWVPSTETFTSAAMPLNSRAYVVANTYSDCPDGIASESVISVEKTAANKNGNIYKMSVLDVNTTRSYASFWGTSGRITAWAKSVIQSETIINHGTVTYDNMIDADNVTTNSVYFAQLNSEGIVSINNMPWNSAGWLVTLTIGSSNSRVQIAVPFYPLTNNVKMRRIHNTLGTTEWVDVGGSDTNITNNYDYEIVQNTYNVTATPTISTGIPYVLTSTGDTTDRTADIAAVLSENGSCMLGTGTFYVTNLSIGDYQSLRGSGIGNTVIKMSDSASGSAISLGTRSSVSDLTVDGGLRTKSTENGGRNGIAWIGTYISSEDTGSVPLRGQISNVHVLGFSGSGIICSNTGTSWAAGLNVVNANVYYCWAGIFIRIYSEYSRFTNIEIDACYYGVINNGGNNMFANCGFNANDIGFYIDNGNSQSPNDSHGSAVGCTFNHSGNNSGIAIKLDGITNGYVFDACQIFFGLIDIKNSVGVQLANCNFGRSVPISINGGGLILFTGNIHRESPSVTKTNTPIVKTTNCYLRDGTEITI